MKHENGARAAHLRTLREAADVNRPCKPVVEVARRCQPYPWRPARQPESANENPGGDRPRSNAVAGDVGWGRVPLPREARRQLAAGHRTRRIASSSDAIRQQKRLLAWALAGSDEGTARTTLAWLAALNPAIAEGEGASVDDGGAA